MIKMDFSNDLNLGKAPKSGGGKPSPILLVLLLLVLVGGGFYYYMENMATSEPVVKAAPTKPKVELKKPEPPMAKPDAKPDMVSSKTVQKETLPEKPKPKPTYNGPAVPVDIQVSNKALSSFINTLYSGTPAGVGFASLAIQSPDYYYIRGMADSKFKYKKFVRNLKSTSGKWKEGKMEPLGVAKVAVDFTSYGTLKALKANPKEKGLNPSQSKTELSKLKSLFKKGAGKTIEPKVIGAEQHVLSKEVQMTFDVDLTFEELKRILAMAVKRKSKVYFHTVRLEAGDQEEMKGSFKISIFESK